MLYGFPDLLIFVFGTCSIEENVGGGWGTCDTIGVSTWEVAGAFVIWGEFLDVFAVPGLDCKNGLVLKFCGLMGEKVLICCCCCCCVAVSTGWNVGILVSTVKKLAGVLLVDCCNWSLEDGFVKGVVVKFWAKSCTLGILCNNCEAAGNNPPKENLLPVVSWTGGGCDCSSGTMYGCGAVKSK